MNYYPAPKSRDEALRWIEWNQRNYVEHGYGLWIVETLAGEFLGDCGLTWQEVNGRQELEVGYHMRPAVQGQGFATEAAAACRDYAASRLGASRLVAITHPKNVASQRVAEKIGMQKVEEDHSGHIPARAVFGMDLAPSVIKGAEHVVNVPPISHADAPRSLQTARCCDRR
jgi:RimJ/RimL family protein N-acetyltransferase